MGIKLRLTILWFLQFFIWGSWLISFGGYIGGSLGFTGLEIGSFYATMGIASLFMPALLGIVADRWIPAQRVLGLAHIISAGALVWAANATEYATLYPAMLLAVMFYMPTLGLSNSVSYNALEKEGVTDIVKVFPKIRVWGTVGFIVAMWVVEFTGFKSNHMQLYLAAAVSLIMGFYSFSAPACSLNKDNSEKKSLLDTLGLKAFVLFKERKMAIFFIFTVFLGAALQVTNAFGEPFLQSFASQPEYADSFGVKYSVILISLSQMSETLFILAIPFALKRFGIKQVMLISMFAWALRFGLFGAGNPGPGLWMLVLSMIVYGMAFDFFNISGSLFVEQNVDSSIRSSAQGLFIVMTNGIGAVIGSYGSGAIVQYYTDANGVTNWAQCWYIFAAYIFVVALLFIVLFKYKHDPNKQVSVQH